MKFIRPLILILVVAGTAQAQASQEQSGSYITYKYSQRLATETYRIRSQAGGIWEAEAEIEVTGQQKVKVTTRTAANKPVSFSEELGGTKLFSAEYGAAGIKIQAPGKPDVEARSKATVILENLVAHHYIQLLSHYDGAKGGRQEFVASLPSQARDFAISVEHKDSPAFRVSGATVNTDHYELVAGAKLQIEIWANSSRMPLLILIESQGLKVIHQESERLAEAVLESRTMEYAGPARGFSTEEVKFNNGDITLAGVLAIPQDKTSRHPAAVIISGSGPQDRDGNPGRLFHIQVDRRTVGIARDRSPSTRRQRSREELDADQAEHISGFD